MAFGYLAIGLLVGFLVGLTGVGGGSLMTPLLVFLFRFKPVVAVGTDLLFAAITKCGGVLVHHGKHKSVHWRIVALMSLGSIPGSLLTLMVLRQYARVGDAQNRIISVSLGVALILTALAQLVRGRLQRMAMARVPDASSQNSFRSFVTVAAGFLIGTLVTLSSVGAGALGTIALLVLYPRMPTLQVVGTDLSFAIPLTLVAGLGHLQLGNVNISLLGSLLVGSLPGIWVGSLLSAKVPDRFLRPILASVLFVVGLKLVM